MSMPRVLRSWHFRRGPDDTNSFCLHAEDRTLLPLSVAQKRYWPRLSQETTDVLRSQQRQILSRLLEFIRLRLASAWRAWVHTCLLRQCWPQFGYTPAPVTRTYRPSLSQVMTKCWTGQRRRTSLSTVLYGEQSTTGVREHAKRSYVQKLIELRLSAMAEQFKQQIQDQAFDSPSFEERFGILTDAEWVRRKNNRLSRLIKKAELHFPNACIEDIEYHADRKLDKALITRLSTCNFIGDRRNIVVHYCSGSLWP